jgi:hypothetical protein
MPPFDALVRGEAENAPRWPAGEESERKPSLRLQRNRAEAESDCPIAGDALASFLHGEATRVSPSGAPAGLIVGAAAFAAGALASCVPAAGGPTGVLASCPAPRRAPAQSDRRIPKEVRKVKALRQVMSCSCAPIAWGRLRAKMKTPSHRVLLRGRALVCRSRKTTCPVRP